MTQNISEAIGQKIVILSAHAKKNRPESQVGETLHFGIKATKRGVIDRVSISLSKQIIVQVG
ncbi:hypothetical protein BTJ39_15405 [Izhakiella australiensis]|uniref:Uncharacterized protein n=1 Tax=Izhakiella australiensis TaxID=1926881 RepID=A0A1S8YIX6_9GAMM|nr:hypothetical protein BTJ39_15405 [Izhakiella australiensis]